MNYVLKYGKLGKETHTSATPTSFVWVALNTFLVIKLRNKLKHQIVYGNSFLNRKCCFNLLNALINMRPRIVNEFLVWVRCRRSCTRPLRYLITILVGVRLQKSYCMCCKMNVSDAFSGECCDSTSLARLLGAPLFFQTNLFSLWILDKSVGGGRSRKLWTFFFIVPERMIILMILVKQLILLIFLCYDINILLIKVLSIKKYIVSKYRSIYVLL